MSVIKQTWYFTSTLTTRTGRRGEGEYGGRGGVEREIVYRSLHCHHQNDSCIKMGSHFTVSLIVTKTESTNYNIFEEKKEPKRYRTEVLLLTSLTPYR